MRAHNNNGVETTHLIVYFSTNYGQDYIRLMIDLASQAEDLEQLDDLHALCSCMQTVRKLVFL